MYLYFRTLFYFVHKPVTGVNNTSKEQMELEKMRLAMGIVISSSPLDLDFVKHIFHQMFLRETLYACDFVCNNWIVHF